MTVPKCRFCKSILKNTFVDLGLSPLCQSQVDPGDIENYEAFYPLHAFVCEACFLVQLREYVSPGDIFSEYAYFSSFSDSWLSHAKAYVDMIIQRLDLKPENFVVELASNDGYLLQNFLGHGIQVLGVEPAANVASAAMEKGVETVVQFFGEQTATELLNGRGPADLMIGNNVLAHVPDINDFVSGIKVMLSRDGCITMEFPHLLRLMDENQFDTIYHEHFSYLSFTTVRRIFEHHGLRLYDVEEIKSHGGSLRIYGCHYENESIKDLPSVLQLMEIEERAGLKQVGTYQNFGTKVKETKRKLLKLLIQLKNDGKTIVGYGAPGKGNTLLNYCGIRTDFIDYTVDRNPYKQGAMLPGSRIPVYSPEKIRETQPDYLLILPWNLKDEIIDQTSYIREWGGKFIVPIPEATVIP